MLTLEIELVHVPYIELEHFSHPAVQVEEAKDGAKQLVSH